MYELQVVMDNGILQVYLSKPGGYVTKIRYNGMDNLLEVLNQKDNRGYTLHYTHSFRPAFLFYFPSIIKQQNTMLAGNNEFAGTGTLFGAKQAVQEQQGYSSGM